MLQKNAYEEDISILAAGTELFAGAAMVYDITVCLEANANAIVNFSDSMTSYDNTHRCNKVVIDGPDTIHLVFPKGLPVDHGLCATSNISSVDVRVSYI